MPTYRTQEYVNYNGQLARVKAVDLAKGGPLLTLATKAGEVTVAAVEVTSARPRFRLAKDPFENRAYLLIVLEKMLVVSQKALALAERGKLGTQHVYQLEYAWFDTTKRNLTRGFIQHSGAGTYVDAVDAAYNQPKDNIAGWVRGIRNALGRLLNFTRGATGERSRGGKSVKATERRDFPQTPDAILRFINANVQRGGGIAASQLRGGGPNFEIRKRVGSDKGKARQALYQLRRAVALLPSFNDLRTDLQYHAPDWYAIVTFEAPHRDMRGKSTAADALGDTLDDIRRYQPGEARRPEIGQVQEIVNGMSKSMKVRELWVDHEQLGRIIGKREAWRFFISGSEVDRVRDLKGRSVVIRKGGNRYQLIYSSSPQARLSGRAKARKARIYRLGTGNYFNSHGRKPSARVYGLWVFKINGKEYQASGVLKEALRKAVAQFEKENPADARQMNILVEVMP